MRMRRTHALVAAGIVAAGAAGAGIAYAAAPGVQADGTVLVCIKNDTKAWRSITGTRCGAGWQALRLNIKGPQGPAGVKGATGAQGAQGAAGAAGPVGPQGPKGDPGNAGQNGADARLSVSASTSLTDRNDSGTGGQTWAKDTLARTVTITREHASPAAKCGSSAKTCWFYTGSVVDVGSFVTVAGEDSPQANVPINGVVSGNVGGGGKLEFYASSDTPSASGVPATLSGNSVATGTWHRQFFGDGTKFAGEGLLDWRWTYTAPNTCETWVNAEDGNSGDVKGVNACEA